MKVISGKYKGRVIKGYDLKRTRPTMDRVKESLFAMIQEKLEGSICLDLFAGSGNLGIEALSEGAKKVTFVDKDKMAIKTILSNCKEIGIKEEMQVLQLDYEKALEKLQNETFDLIFLDPPYKTDYIETALAKIASFSLLDTDGIVVVESDRLENSMIPKCYEEIKRRKYGSKEVLLLRLCK